MQTMYDAVNVANIPADATLIAAYIDGAYANVQAMRDRFPAARIVTITVTGARDADVLDVETGDATPEHAPDWVKRMRDKGRTPTVYCPSSLWLPCMRAFDARGIAYPAWWIAHYEKDPVIPAGAVAKQYRNAVPPGYDVSSTLDSWPDSAPIHKVAPMFDPPVSTVASVAAPDGRGGWLLLADGGVYTFGDAQFYGAPIGKAYWGARKPALIRLSAHPGKVYDVLATDGAEYSYPE